MIKVEILKNETFKTEQDLPKKGSEFSTGHDVITASEPKIVGEYILAENNGKHYSSIDYIEYDTNLCIAPQYRKWKMKDISTIIDYYDSLMLSRSSVSKYNLILANCIGLIDNDYRNSIKFRFKYIFQPEDYIMTNNGLFGKVNEKKIYQKGEKIGQLKFTKVIDAEFVLVDKLSETNRGLGGFGSTGK